MFNNMYLAAVVCHTTGLQITLRLNDERCAMQASMQTHVFFNVGTDPGTCAHETLLFQGYQSHHLLLSPKKLDAELSPSEDKAWLQMWL